MFSISDAYGKIRSDFTDEELAQLDDKQADALTMVIASARKSEVAEKADAEAKRSADDLLDILSAAEQAIRDTMPPAPDRIDEVRRMSENGRRATLGLAPLPSQVFKPKKELVTAVEKAERALSSARQRVAQTGVEVRAARAVLGDALREWTKLNSVETQDVIRDHLARQQEYYRKIADGEVETIAEVEHTPSHLDRSLGSGRNVGAHHAVNYGYGRKHSRRGTVIPPKLPSQR